MSHSREWQQYFPTYHFKNRDILLKEYEVSAKSVESLERLYLNAVNILGITATGLVALAVALLQSPSERISSLLTPNRLWAPLVLFLFISLLTIKYFAERHRSIIFDSRKIVVLRRMLGLDYGAQRLVLPNWRVEGATNPFVLRMFPGWLSYIAYPFWVVYMASLFLLYQLLPYMWEKALTETPKLSQISSPASLLLVALGVWSVLAFYVYRSNLFDIHENRRLSYARIIASLLKLKLVENFEYLIYRARLAKYETRRTGVQLDYFIKALIFIEDRSFLSHKGVSVRATLRAVLGLFGVKRRSGGSTITQQLVRTLFISDIHKTIRRKLVEYPLAIWFDKEIGKSELLEIYLSSVRFANGVYGVPAALKHFFGGRLDQPIPMAKAFFLIERVSNVRDGILLDKIKHTSRQMLDEGLLSESDIHDLKKIYARMVKKRLLRPINKHDFDAWCQQR